MYNRNSRSRGSRHGYTERGLRKRSMMSQRSSLTGRSKSGLTLSEIEYEDEKQSRISLLNDSGYSLKKPK